jgi:hypothetical protein
VELASYLRKAAETRKLSIQEIARRLDQPFERVRHYFRTDRIGSRLPPVETWEQIKNLLGLDGSYDEAMTVEYGDNVFRNHPMGRNPGDVQSFPVAYSEDDHFAVMPGKLAEWCLRASLPSGALCLDPFMGSGTTGRATLALGGRFIGIDTDPAVVRRFASGAWPRQLSFRGKLFRQVNSPADEAEGRFDF